MASYFWLDGSNNRYYIGRPFTLNGVQYTTTGASSTTFTSLGFTQITIASKPDERFFTVTGPNNDGSWTSTARPLAEVKDTYVENQRALLSRTVSASPSLAELLYAFKDSASLPATWVTFLTDAKTYRDANNVKINAVASVGALQTLIAQEKWVLVTPADANDGYTTNSSTYLEPMPLNPHELEEVFGTLTIVRNGADLTSAKFGTSTADAAAAKDVRGVFGYELKIKAVNTPGTTLSYSMPNGFSGTGLFPATGTTDIEVYYQSITGTQVGTTLTLADSTSTQTFNFGNQY